MAETRTFPLHDVLSVTTGTLMTDMEGLYGILNFLTGDSLFTHQLSRASEFAQQRLYEQHPWLADLQPPIGAELPGLIKWLIKAEREHGITMDLAPLGGWIHTDPIADLTDLMGADRVVTVMVDGQEDGNG